MAFTSNGLYDQTYVYNVPIYSTASTSQTFQFIGNLDPPSEPAPPPPATAVEWLRGRVAETCEAAFEGIAA